MINIKINLKDAKETSERCYKLSGELKSKGVKLPWLANRLVQLMREFAPKATWHLASSIRLVSTGSKRAVIDIGAAYGAAQEFGYKPRYIPANWISAHESQPGKRGEWIDRGNISKFIRISRHTPYVKPAINAIGPYFKYMVLTTIKNYYKS